MIRALIVLWMVSTVINVFLIGMLCGTTHVSEDTVRKWFCWAIFAAPFFMAYAVLLLVMHHTASLFSVDRWRGNSPANREGEKYKDIFKED